MLVPGSAAAVQDEPCQISVRTKLVLEALDEFVALHSRVSSAPVADARLDLAGLVDFELPGDGVCGDAAPAAVAVAEPVTDQICSSVVDALDVYIATLPAAYGQDAAQVPALAGQFANDCATVAAWAQSQRLRDSLGHERALVFAERGERLTLMGQECFEHQLVCAVLLTRVGAVLCGVELTE